LEFKKYWSVIRHWLWP